ncbi:MAG: thioredoxin domain-containing protein [Desulfobacterales bacterium]
MQLSEDEYTFYGKVQFTKCDVGDNPVTPAKYGIKSIPDLIFFKQGKIVGRFTGIVGRSKLKKMINDLLQGV